MPARLRLRNDTDADFDQVELGVDQLYELGALPAQETSAYLAVANLFSYGYVRALHGAGEYRYEVTDDAGWPLPPGDYTYALHAAPGATPDPTATPPRYVWLQIELIIDHILESSAPGGSEP